ncbi:MAG: 16S rRNA (cytidine(1402)-2'-O)-methyltransferase [Desulfotomaculaceae bacterium]|nr:16S rRNA (cytidine(1402)-2'-O)-methyltransferase [Desulfotomaculaceae bacterium]MDD4766876.1 16S rRNA (cytidine(1402)-2'-O)-methyltransferase [Desulfotomaculaceae bacterium]
MTEDTKGTLYLCATPIGNLEDITLRVLRILREVDLIAAEDTRHTRKLLSHFQIHTPLTSYHRHNCKKKGEQLLRLVSEGKNIALVSDAGMPGVSDPGVELVAEAVKKGCAVTAAPGPSAAVTALVVSGLPVDSYVFAGFLPAAKKARAEKLKELSRQQWTMIFYEAPHRMKETLAILLQALGNRPAVAARELTKLHEEVIRGSLEDLVDHFNTVEPRGEFTLVVAGAPPAEIPSEQETAWRHIGAAAHVFRLEEEGIERKKAIQEVARLRGLPKKDVYRLVVEDKKFKEV